jgi:hypothetical protein
VSEQNASALPARPESRWPVRIETFFALLVLAGLIYMAALTVIYGYFPQPFFWDTDDTFRDWFSTAVWAHEEGAYDAWLSVYPPFSFAILKFMGDPNCYIHMSDKVARSCDWVGLGFMHAIYVLNGVLVSRIYMKIDRQTAWQRSFTITAGMPMLFGLERGNLILLTFTFVMLGFGPLVHSARLRWLYVAMAVNMKVYLIAAVFTQLIKRKWLWFEAVVVLIVLVYLISFLIYGAGTPIEVYKNLVNFASGGAPGSVLDIWYPNTYVALRFVLGESDAPVNMFLGSDEIGWALLFIPLTQHSAQAMILLACVAAWVRPEVVPTYRLTFLAIALAMITSEASAYTQPVMFFFVFMEKWKGWLRPLAIATCYLLSIPGEIHIGIPLDVMQYSYIGQRYVVAQQGLALGMLLKPFMLMLPAYFLGLLTILDVWKDIRFQGWSHRWRFRNDWPLLPGLRRPVSPSPSPRPEPAGAPEALA